MRCFPRNVLEEFSSQEKIRLDMTNSLQVRTFILSKEVGHLFWVLNKIGENSWEIIILRNFVNNP